MKTRLFVALLTVALLVVLPLLSVSAQVKQPAEWITAKRLTVATRADIGTNLTVAGTSALGQVRLTPATVISVTNGLTLTLTAGYQPLTSAGTVTFTLAAGDAGQIAVLVNASDTTLNLADTGAAKLTAAAALGQYDSLTLLSDGTNWIEVARANN